jgi:hypothetical protein
LPCGSNTTINMGAIDFDGIVEEQLGDVVEPLVFNTHAH